MMALLISSNAFAESVDEVGSSDISEINDVTINNMRSGFVEIGSEYEDYQGSFDSTNTFMLPYLAAGFQPSENIPFHMFFKYSNQNFSGDSSQGKGGRDRQEYGFQYRWKVTDNFDFNPQLIIRHNHYNKTQEHDTEWRIFPNMSYKINDKFKISLDGFIAPHTQSVKDRTGETSNRKHYTDYKHELDFRLHTQFNDNSGLITSFYNEHFKANDLPTDSSNTESMDEWQLRLVYSHIIGDLTVQPFARIPLKRTFESASGEQKDQSRLRIGFMGRYKIDTNLALVYEVYGQTEEQVNFDQTTNPEDRDYMFYKLGINYTF